MIVAKKSYNNNRNYITYGNHALDYERVEDYQQKKKNSKKRNKDNKKKHIKQVKNQMKLMGMVVLIFITSTVIIGRYAMIMSLNNQNTNMKKQLVINQKENENLKIELLKYYDIKEIEEYAVTELNMKRPDYSQIVHINAEINNNDNITGVNSELKKNGFLNKLIFYINKWI